MSMSRVAFVAFVLVVAVSAAPPTASSICVYNDAAFVLKWHLKNPATGAVSPETSSYPVWQTKCLDASTVPNTDPGAALVPVIRAVWGDENTAGETVMYDAVNVSVMSYTCKGTTLDFNCEQGAPPPTAGNVTKKVGEFMIGFTEGLGTDIGFTDCIQDLNATVRVIEAIIDLFESGVNLKKISTIVRAFQLIGELVKDIGTAVTACVKDATAFVAKMKSLASALSGDVLSVIKVVVEEAVHIFRDRTEITNDCKGTVTSWRGGDFKDAGQDVGDIVGIILGGLERAVPIQMYKPSA